MKAFVYVGFAAVATDENGHDYDCSFVVSYPQNAVNQVQVNNALNLAVQQFQSYHQNGRIVKKMKRIVFK